MVSGPSGSGKSSIVRELLDRLDIAFSVSATTRLPRPGERHGDHYDFVSLKDFEAMIEEGELLEWATYNNRYYGTPKTGVDAALSEGKDILLEIEIQERARCEPTARTPSCSSSPHPRSTSWSSA